MKIDLSGTTLSLRGGIRGRDAVWETSMNLTVNRSLFQPLTPHHNHVFEQTVGSRNDRWSVRMRTTNFLFIIGLSLPPLDAHNPPRCTKLSSTLSRCEAIPQFPHVPPAGIKCLILGSFHALFVSEGGRWGWIKIVAHCLAVLSSRGRQTVKTPSQKDVLSFCPLDYRMCACHKGRYFSNVSYCHLDI